AEVVDSCGHRLFRAGHHRVAADPAHLEFVPFRIRSFRAHRVHGSGPADAPLLLAACGAGWERRRTCPVLDFARERSRRVLTRSVAAGLGTRRAPHATQRGARNTDRGATVLGLWSESARASPP